MGQELELEGIEADKTETVELRHFVNFSDVSARDIGFEYEGFVEMSPRPLIASCQYATNRVFVAVFRHFCVISKVSTSPFLGKATSVFSAETDGVADLPSSPSAPSRLSIPDLVDCSREMEWELELVKDGISIGTIC